MRQKDKRMVFRVTAEDENRIKQAYQHFIDRLPAVSKEAPPPFSQWMGAVLLSVDEASERMARLEAELAAERHATSIAMSHNAKHTCLLYTSPSPRD